MTDANSASSDETPPQETTDETIKEQVDFGYKKVTADEKDTLVKGVFSSVAEKYDVMNDLMSMGIHRLWKQRLIQRLNPKPAMQLLDVAGGTGDIGQRFLKAGGAQVTVCDLTEDMVRVGRDRALIGGYNAKMNWIVGQGEHLPIPDRAFDACTIAFGLRNTTQIDMVLHEIRRILKPGGLFLCLEFSHLSIPMLDRLYAAYSFTIFPHPGKIVTGDGDSYRYLVESIRRFPDQQKLVDKITAAGFSFARYENLTGGVAAIHSGWRI